PEPLSRPQGLVETTPTRGSLRSPRRVRCRQEVPVRQALSHQGTDDIAPRSNASRRDARVSAVCWLSRSRVRHTRGLLCKFLCECSFLRETRCQTPAQTGCCASHQSQSRV